LQNESFAAAFFLRLGSVNVEKQVIFSKNCIAKPESVPNSVEIEIA